MKKHRLVSFVAINLDVDGIVPLCLETLYATESITQKFFKHLNSPT